MLGSSLQTRLPTAEEALAGSPVPTYPVPERHAVLGTPLRGPWPEGTATIYLAMGCFWGAERIFWQTPGVVTTAAGYQGGRTPNPTYEQTCTGRTGHTEAVLVAYDPSVLSTSALLKLFWESHDPTQGFRQGNDRGTQYRSAAYWTTADQHAALEAGRSAYAEMLAGRGYGEITTEIRSAADAGEFYYAEGYHQQYLHKVPNGYCGIGGTGVSCPAPGRPD